jgi:ribonuclease HIII
MTRLEGIPRGPRVAGVDEVGRGCLFGPGLRRCCGFG